MENIDELKRAIVFRVREFCKDMISGSVNKEVVSRYGIPEKVLMICGDESNGCNRKFNGLLFRYVMDMVGFYDHLSDPEKLQQIYSSLDSLLMNPLTESKHRSIFLRPMILGVESILDRIVRITSYDSVEFEGKSVLQELSLTKDKRDFKISYRRDPRSISDLETDATKEILIGEEVFEIPHGGRHTYSHRSDFFSPDDVTVALTRFKSRGLDEEIPYFFRYITEIDPKQKFDFQGKIDWTTCCIDGELITTVEAEVDGELFRMFYYPKGGRQFLIMEYDAPLKADEFSDLCFSALVALGMLSTNLYLNDCWLAAYEDVSRENSIGLMYKSLVPSVHCNYPIFSTNVFSGLIPAAMKIDPKKGEKRAISLIDSYKLSNALPPFPNDVFGRLVENFRHYEKLQRGIFIILSGSEYHLEMQSPNYCVALEAISGMDKVILGDKKEALIPDKKRWRKVYDRFVAEADNLCKEGIVSEDEAESLKKKINGMNSQFNSDKLTALLEFYHYPLTDFDRQTLSARNPLLHGNIELKGMKDRKTEDALFDLSINLHKLCCALALLIAGYKGYILNNRKFYGYDKSVKSFIRIGPGLN